MREPSLIDRRPWTNWLQVAAGIVGSIIGAIYAYPIHPKLHWLSAFVGALVGFAAFVFISGAMLVFAPVAYTYKSVNAEKYVRLNGRARLAFKLYISAACAAIVMIPAMGGWFPREGLVLCAISVHTVPYIWVRFCQGALEDIQCPHCRGRFGFHGITPVLQHRCLSCGASFFESPVVKQSPGNEL